MIVYVLIESWQMDCGESGLSVDVYKTYEQAFESLLAKREQAKEDMCDLPTEEDALNDGSMCWSIWEKDEYCYNHIDLKIEKKEVIKGE